MIVLKEFQKNAIEKLSISFLNLWETNDRNLPLVFKSPTGSGKTIMMAEFLKNLEKNYNFYEEKAYIWISFGGDDSYTQSKNKLYSYFNNGTDMHLKDINNINEQKIYNNNIFFINWSKIKGKDKESRKLRKPCEKVEGDYGIFDEYIYNTNKERDIVLIIDEAHTETETLLANDIIELINPRIIIKVTATPKNLPSISEVQQNKAGFVEVLESDVINSGLIKQQIIIQTEEDINNLKSSDLTEDERMVELAFNKRAFLKQKYAEAGEKINPLMLIQLPNDFKEEAELKSNQKEIVLSYLKEKGVKDSEIAIWLSNERTNNLNGIENNNSEVSYLIFKVAPATGWDCPRADVLVMFREINSPTFHTQIIGRIKRMPRGELYKDTSLNNAYIYTNYNKKHIRDVKETELHNKPTIYYDSLKDGIEQIELETTFHHRIDFNTLTPPPLWQKEFMKTLDNFFGTKKGDFSNNKAIVLDKIDLNISSIKNEILVNSVVTSYDNFMKNLIDSGKDINYNFSDIDVERLYNLCCYNELKNQTDEEAKYNASRSWGQLKSALNVWVNTRFDFDSEIFYTIIVTELLKLESKLKSSINIALKNFRDKYNIEVINKDKIEKYRITIPMEEIGYTDDYEIVIGKPVKYALNKFYNKKDYFGKINEEEFIGILEKQEKIIWWYKQEDSGKNVFAIEYFSTTENKPRLFYPDFLIKTDKKLYILDTKSGFTAKSQETADKSNALQKWIEENKEKYSFDIKGGIVVKFYPDWKVYTGSNYTYNEKEGWTKITF